MAEPWIRVHANLRRKPVTGRAAERLGVSRHEAMGILIEFWGSVSQHAEHGIVGAQSDDQLEEWAGWTRKRGRFAAFVRECHLDADGRVNEWEDYAGTLELRREYDRQRKRDERERKKQERAARDAARKSGGRHTDTPPDRPQDVTGTSAPTIRNDTKRKKSLTAAVASDAEPNGASSGESSTDPVTPVPKRVAAKPATESRLDVFPKATCDEAYQRWSKVLGAVDYGRFRKALLPAFVAEPNRYDGPVLAGGVEAFSEGAAGDDPKFRGKWTPEKFAAELHAWVRLGLMELVDDWGQPTERGRASGIFAA